MSTINDLGQCIGGNGVYILQCTWNSFSGFFLGVFCKLGISTLYPCRVRVHLLRKASIPVGKLQAESKLKTGLMARVKQDQLFFKNR